VSKHTVSGFIVYPFEAEVDTGHPEWFSVTDLYSAFSVANGYSFSRVALSDDSFDVFVQDSKAEAIIASIRSGGIEWSEDADLIRIVGEGV